MLKTTGNPAAEAGSGSVYVTSVCFWVASISDPFIGDLCPVMPFCSPLFIIFFFPEKGRAFTWVSDSPYQLF